MCSWNLCDFCQQVNDIHVYHYMGLVDPGGGGGRSTLLDCAVRPIIRNRILLKYLVYGFECLKRTSYKNTLQIYNCTKQKVHYYPKRKVER